MRSAKKPLARSLGLGTITKMGNICTRHKLKNAAGRKAAAAIQAATPNALCGCVLRPRAGSGLGDKVSCLDQFYPVLPVNRLGPNTQFIVWFSPGLVGAKLNRVWFGKRLNL